MILTLLKVVGISLLISSSALFNTEPDAELPHKTNLTAPAPCVEINVDISDEASGPGGTCRALGTVTANGVCNGVLKCGFRAEDIYRIPCCSDFGKASGWCKESSDLESN